MKLHPSNYGTVNGNMTLNSPNRVLYLDPNTGQLLMPMMKTTLNAPIRPTATTAPLAALANKNSNNSTQIHHEEHSNVQLRPKKSERPPPPERRDSIPAKLRETLESSGIEALAASDKSAVEDVSVVLFNGLMRGKSRPPLRIMSDVDDEEDEDEQRRENQPRPHSSTGLIPAGDSLACNKLGNEGLQGALSCLSLAASHSMLAGLGKSASSDDASEEDDNCVTCRALKEARLNGSRRALSKPDLSLIQVSLPSRISIQSPHYAIHCAV
ncbi:hypothetical protein Ciccas_006308 [Cichlidogyrus casuarinus]|uniref:Uncharacterized protein n=1 Tax=Cichlidogyrus casuarinus TaxID=1844966 RepID=A0ABD2Q799_9PLAT